MRLRRGFWIVHLALLLTAAISLSSGTAAVPNFKPGEAIDSVEAESYNIWLTLAPAAERTKGASAAVIFAREGDRFYAVALDGRGTALYRCGGGKKRRLARGTAAVRAGEPVEVVIKRRPIAIRVEAGGEVLLEAWDASYHEGEVCLGSGGRGLEVGDVLAQAVGRVLYNEDFLADSDREALWEPLSGSWEIEAYHDPVRARDRPAAQASWYAAQGHDAVSLTGDEFWEDYRVEVSALARRDTWMGVAFFATPDGFTRFAVMPGPEQGRAGLFCVQGGEQRLLAQAPVSCVPELWHRLAVEATATDIRAFVNGEPVLSAPTPGAGAGRAGLFVSGHGKVHFDDFAARGMDSFVDHFASGLEGRWDLPAGKWRLARGRLRRVAASDALALVAHRTWPDASVSVSLADSAGAPAGPVWRFQDDDNHYALLASGDAWRLVRKLDGAETALADGPLPEEAGGRLGVVCRGPQMVVEVAGREVGRAYDFSFRDGRVGLLVRGKGRAAVDDFEVRSVAANPAMTVSLVRCEGERLPGHEHGRFLPVIGYLWRPTPRTWQRPGLSNDNHAMRGVASRGRQALLAYREAAPGSVMLSASLPAAPRGAGGLAICTDGKDARTGYAVTCSTEPAPSLQLLRQGQVVAQLDELQAEDLSWPSTLTIFRDGPTVGAALGSSGITYSDEEPLADGRPLIWVSSGQALFDDIRLANLRATVDRLDRPAPQWAPSHGRWLVHSGMACIEWDYWTSAFGEPLALTWRREPRARDLVLEFNVSEYSEGEESGKHRHFPYHDISVAFCGDGREPDSGYRFVIGADRGRATKLLRQGQVVAETSDRRFRIAMGSHCNTPRGFDARVAKRGGHMSLRLNGVTALEYTDPEPLGPGQVGIGAGQCRANFRDVALYTWP
ncbi:MAG: hypothetical protein PVH68_11170 [Armatimonadota bacterium]